MEVAVVSLVSVAACLLRIYGYGWLFSLPTAALTLSAPSLSLLLVFRTNGCYGRWDDARRILGLSLNRCRDLTRQAITWFPNTSDGDVLRKKFVRYVQAWPYVLKCHLRGGPGGCENDDNIKEDLKDILTEKEVVGVINSPHRPLHVLHEMTETGRKAGLQTANQITLDQNLGALSDVVGGCERILRTPIPLSYSRMTARFLVLWLLALPFSLSRDIVLAGFSVWYTVPCVAVIAFLLLGIEELATQLEEPFSILPMGPYADTNKTNSDGMMAMADK
jgi:predicted membrane chloride channel (bestrophin family)